MILNPRVAALLLACVTLIEIHKCSPTKSVFIALSLKPRSCRIQRLSVVLPSSPTLDDEDEDDYDPDLGPRRAHRPWTLKEDEAVRILESRPETWV